ncbi:MAG: amidase [Actinomycetota bacterium]
MPGSVDAGRDVSHLLDALRRGEISAETAVSACLEELRRVDGLTNAVAFWADERALANARQLDQAFSRDGATGPLHGLPVTVKDWIDVEGFPCEGDAGPAGRRPSRDATVVARLRQAGAVIVAKTRAWGPDREPGRVRHLDDPSRTAGGSSTGEAVVVASGASPLGIGSDSGGSIRLPAAWCGVYGFKPTAGRIPTTGHYPRVGPLSDGRTQIGPLARCVPDLELILAVCSGPDWQDAGTAPVPLRSSGQVSLRGARYAVVTGEDEAEGAASGETGGGADSADGAGGWTPSAPMAGAVGRAAAVLDAAGLTRVSWPAPWLAGAMEVTLQYWARARGELRGKEASQLLHDWDRFRRRYLMAAEHVDLLLTPTVRETAPLHRAITGSDFVYTLPASLTGSPAVTVPAGLDPAGLPLSVQLTGRPWEDHVVLAAARHLQDAWTSSS